MEETLKLQQIKKDAELALYKKDPQSAWELYSQALSLCEKSGFKDEYKRILGKRAMVAVTLQKQEEAISNSIAYIMMDEQNEAGFWCAATALQKLKLFDKALDMLIKGFKIAEEPSAFLTEIVRFISKLKPTTDMQAYLKVLDSHPKLRTKQMSIDTQKIVIQKLCDMDCWEGVSLLVIGNHSGLKSDFDKMLAECPATNVPVGKLLISSSRKNLRTFGLQLAVALLDNGASVLQLEQEMGIPMIHIGLKMYLETDKDTLIKWFFKSSMNEQSHRDACDTEGNTVLHTLVKNPVKGEKRNINILNYLLENGCPSELPDGNGKLPIDYVSPKDTYYSVLMKAKITPDERSPNTIENDDIQSTTAMDEFDNLLKQGNEYLDRNALNKALEMFLKAKELLHKESLNCEINKAALHNVQCSILECHLRKGNFKSALENALQRIDIDDESPRFLYLLGRSHAGLYSWIEAITSFVRAAVQKQDYNLKLEKDIIFHISKACPKYLEITKGVKAGFKVFTKLPTRLKCSIVFQLVINREWDAAYTFFHRFSTEFQTSFKDQTVSELLDLKQLCNIKIFSEHLWLTDFITILVANNLADFRQIILKTKEQYLHACVRIASETENTNLLEQVVIKARACNEENIVDSKGNTPLHLAVQLKASKIKSNPVTLNMIQKLLENGANFLQKNDEGKTAREYVPMSNASLCKKMIFFEKGATRFNHKEFKAKEESVKFKKRKKGKPRCVQLPDLPQQKIELEKSEIGENCQCGSVVDMIRMRRDQFVEGDIALLINVLQENHTSSTHREVLDECILLMADIICSSDINGIPTSLAKIDDALYKSFLQKLIQMEKWEVMKDALTLCKCKGSAKSLQIFRQILTETITNTAESEEKICKIFEHLPDGENIINEDDEILVKSAIKGSYFKVLELLFQSHVNPKYLSLEPGDTPIHAAANMYLNDNSSTIFKDFVTSYIRNANENKCLNPHQTDFKGNNLFHLVAKSKICPRSCELAKQLNGLHVSVSCRNKDGKLPKDYLQCDNKEMLKIFGKMDSTVEEKIEKLKEQIREIISVLTDNSASPKKPLHCIEKENCLELEKVSQEKVLDQRQTEIEFDVTEFDNLLWEVECSPSFLKKMTRHKIPLQTRLKAVQDIKDLGEGQRRAHLCKRLKIDDSNRALFEIKLDKAGRIIWEIALNYSPRINHPCASFEGNVFISEVIRIWDIVLDHDNLHRCVKNILRSYSKSIQSQLLHTRVKKESVCVETDPCSLVKPKIFKCVSEENHIAGPELELETVCLPMNPKEHEFNIMKFYSFSSDVVYHIIENLPTEIDFPFKVTDLEHEIINMKSKAPILLVGRSGTGKTTCCLYRLWKKFEMYWTLIPSLSSTTNTDIDDGEEKQHEEKAVNDMPDTGREKTLRQLFITKNPVLCQEVKRNFLDMKRACKVWRSSNASRQQYLPSKFQDVEEDNYPLFLTFKKLLEVLDASLGSPFCLSNDDLTLNIQGWGDANDVSDLSKFKDADSDFEDFLEVDTEDSGDEMGAKGFSNSLNQRKSNTANSRKLLTYETFEKVFWIKMNKEKSKCHPSLVWAEIMSFIKGSFQALLSPNGYLDLKQYTELGRKIAPVFTDDREKIFEMFLIYENLKKQTSYTDEADIARNVFKRMTKVETTDLLVHEIYVDETQDFTQAELCMLVRLCQNPNGIFLTGDTAQCIMRGISFRFEDLRSLFFQIREISQRKNSVNVPKELFHLTQNYRSHAGILNLASSVLELLKEFFPESFDHLEKDVGMIDGPKPVILNQSNSKNLIQLLTGNTRETSSIELGAHQVILVSNQETKEKIKSEFNKCLIMTIDRAKGLEFDDVLLYNFFKESHATKEWRVVKQYLDKINKPSSSRKTKIKPGFYEYRHSDLVASRQVRPLAFDPRKHKALCTELKVLYTAITRARANVWIFDEDEESRGPMFEYFTERELVDVRDGVSSKFSQPSDDGDWLSKGNLLFRKSRFEEAADCYKNANHFRRAEYAIARHHEQQAQFFEKIDRQYHLLAAALGFCNCNKLKSVLSCLRQASEFVMLAEFYESRNEIKKAADMYGRAGMPVSQSKCLEKLEYFGEALSILIQSANFDHALDCLQRSETHGNSKDTVPKDLESEDKICYKAAKYFGKRRDKDSMMKYATRISYEKRKYIFLSCNFIEEAERLLLDKGNKYELVEFYMRNGDIHKALGYLNIQNDMDRTLRHECIVIGAQIAFQSLRNREISLEYLNEITQDKKQNFYFKARAYLLRGQLTENQDDVLNAFHMFRDEELPEKLECIEWIMHKINLNQNKDIQNILMILGNLKPSFQKLLDRNDLQELIHPDSDYTFYGLYRERNGDYKLYPGQEPTAISFFNVSKGEFEISLKKGSVRRNVLDFVEKKVNRWFQRLQGSINMLKKKAREYIENPIETNVPKMLKQTIGNKTENEKFKTEFLFWHMHLHMLSLELCFISHGVDFKGCKEFTSALVSFNATQKFSKHNRESKKTISCLLRDCLDSELKKAMKKSLLAMSRNLEEKRNSTQRFAEFVLLRGAMALEDVNVSKIFSDYEKQHQITFGRNSGDKGLQEAKGKGKTERIYIKDGNSKCELCSKAKPLFETVEHICNGETEGACKYFEEFCSHFQKSNNTDQFELSFDVFFLLSEYIITIRYIYAIGEESLSAIILPDYFISRMHYVENIFLKDASTCALEQKKSHKSKFNFEEPENNLQNLISILCGYSCGVNLLEIARKPKNNHVLERMLVLCFVLLCNFGPGLNLNDSAIELMKEVSITLYAFYKETVFKQFETLVKTTDLVKSLSIFAKTDILCLQFCDLQDRIDVQNVRSIEEIEKLLRPSDLNEKVLKAIQTPIQISKEKSEKTSTDVNNTTYSMSGSAEYEEQYTPLPKPMGQHPMDKKDSTEHDPVGKKHVKKQNRINKKDVKKQDTKDINDVKEQDTMDKREIKGQDPIDIKDAKEQDATNKTDVEEQDAMDKTNLKEQDAKDKTDVHRQDPIDIKDFNEQDKDKNYLKEQEAKDKTGIEEQDSKDNTDVKTQNLMDKTDVKELDATNKSDFKEQDAMDKTNLKEQDAKDKTDSKEQDAKDKTDTKEQDAMDKTDSKEHQDAMDKTDSNEQDVNDKMGL